MELQMIPIFLLGLYILYVSYYYATPMFFLKVMLFIAHIRYRDIDIRFEERRILVRFSRDGMEHVVERAVDEDLESRFWPMSLCSAFRKLLKELRKGNLLEGSPDADGVDRNETVQDRTED